MMSASQFSKKSSIFLHRRKSALIQDIDKLLKEYERSASENRKMKCLVYIYMMCKHYLFTKPNGRRGDAVRELLGQARTTLDSASFQKEIAAKAGGRHYSGGRMTDVMSTAGASATSLSKGYTYEGILPQKNFVQKMRLNMNSILDSDQKYFGASMLSRSLEIELQDKGMAAGADKEAARLLGTMPMSEILDRLHLMWADTAFQGEFNYLNAAQRIQYLLLVKNNGQIFRYKDNAVFDTGTTWGNAPRSAAYAMDTDERIFSIGDASGVGVNWNHSSMLSGHAVICAGEISVSQGRLIKIDNNSGHYKPDSQNLADCVRALGDAGVDLQSFAIEDKARNQTYNTAAQFVAMHG